MIIDLQAVPWYIMYLSGFLSAAGLLILLPDTASNRLTARDNLGWFLLASGILLLVGWFALPFFPIIRDALILMWERSTDTMLIALALGIVLTVCGYAVRRAHH